MIDFGSTHDIRDQSKDAGEVARLFRGNSARKYSESQFENSAVFSIIPRSFECSNEVGARSGLCPLGDDVHCYG